MGDSRSISRVPCCPAPHQLTGGPRHAGRPVTLVAPAGRVPRPIIGLAVPALLILLAALGVSGCSREPHYSPGCYLNSAVNEKTRVELESAAERFYALLRSGDYDHAYEEAAETLKKRIEKDKISRTWASLAEVLTIPQQVRTEEIAVASIAGGTRGPQELTCIDPADSAGGRTIQTTDQPLQAYLIQSAEVRGTTYNYASVWFYEEGRWRLATFGAKPRKQLGHDWRYYLELARTQREKGNLRNAALLYNMAMDLMVPAPWIKPDMITKLQQEQRSITVENLPAGRKLQWIASDGTVFEPYQVNYDLEPNALVLRVSYEVSATPIDTAVVARQAPVLARFIRTTFPEYSDVFSTMALDATTPVRHEPVWSGTFSFRER